MGLALRPSSTRAVDALSRDSRALDLACAECGRKPRAGETWRILFADKVTRETVIYCQECAEREFSAPE